MTQKADKPDLKTKQAIKVEFTWESPERVWEPKTRVWYLSVAAVILFIILIMVRLNYLIIILGAIAVMLLLFVQATLQPWIIKHRITNKGIYTHNVLYRWDMISFFWFGIKKDRLVLYLDFKKEAELPRLPILINRKDDKVVFDMLIKEIKYGEPSEVGYDIFSRFIYGAYVPISNYIRDLDQPLDLEEEADKKHDMEQKTEPVS